MGARVDAVIDSPNVNSELIVLVARNLQLEKDLYNLKGDHVRAVGECHEAHNKIKVLEAKIIELSIKEESHDDTLKETFENEAKQVKMSRAILEFSFKKRSTVPTLPRHLSDLTHIPFQD